MSGWSKATLTQNDVVGPGLNRLTLEVPAAVASGFHVPGQYHRVRAPSGEDGTFAIASAPGSDRFEYLIRENEGVAGELAALAPGEVIRVGMPDGPGFPYERARAHPLLLIGTGTGFAPLRSVIRTLMQHRAVYGEVHGAYGVLTPAHLAFGPEMADWESAHIHITPTVTAASAAWKGEVGQVQALLARLPMQNAIAFLCGQNEMVQQVTGLLEQRGVPADRVFVNF
ncbi:MAG: NAD-binding oxidoreductase [Archangium sp.]|nr:NAD-binding oxidoreductase [Archangium sp.]MDP3574815.1 NAD-binding oxidoreductase [Archangium sp.]